MSPADFTVLASGSWEPDQITARVVPSGRRIIPEIEQRIESHWQQAAARPGIHLFDGPMCRLERFVGAPGRLELDLSPTSYKPFVGTNLSGGAALAAKFGAECLANPVGLSTALLTADDFLLLGRRNASVAYYPDRIHPFAGALEPDEGGGAPDVFANVRRELHEELAMSDSDIAELRCIGIARDDSLLQPEMIFLTRSALTRGQLEPHLDRSEHTAIVAFDRAAISTIERDTQFSQFTPIARAALHLWRLATRSLAGGAPGA